MTHHNTQGARVYRTIEELLTFIDQPYRGICERILEENRKLFQTARGSTHNHQTWEGGYIDHITDGMNFIMHLYSFMQAFGRPLPFTLADALLVFFLHDLEKPWRIELLPDGTVRNRSGLETKQQFKDFREAKLRSYGLVLTPYLQNAFTYVEGELHDYSSERRVMNELASFCHMVDNWCARGWYNYPKVHGDEWEGARRVRKER